MEAAHNRPSPPLGLWEVTGRPRTTKTNASPVAIGSPCKDATGAVSGISILITVVSGLGDMGSTGIAVGTILNPQARTYGDGSVVADFNLLATPLLS